MVSSASSYASYVGLDILKKGGNAIDAAVAMGFALAVTYPQAGNIGGGGFIVLRTKDNKITSVDFREKAPLLSYRDMFLDEKGDYDPDKSQFGHLSSGVPGSVAGLLDALEKYGTMSREEILEPSIKLDEDGFIIEKHFAQSLNSNHKEFSEFESTRKIFTQKGGFREGGVFRQPELANTLRLIMIHGKDGFYSGITAELIEKEMRTHGGLLTKDRFKSCSTLYWMSRRR